MARGGGAWSSLVVRPAVRPVVAPHVRTDPVRTAVVDVRPVRPLGVRAAVVVRSPVRPLGVTDGTDEGADTFVRHYSARRPPRGHLPARSRRGGRGRVCDYESAYQCANIYPMDDTCYKEIQSAADVDSELLEMAESVYDGWYSEGRIDWEDFIDRLDESICQDGRVIDLGDSLDSPAIRKIKAHIRAYRRM